MIKKIIIRLAATCASTCFSTCSVLLSFPKHNPPWISPSDMQILHVEQSPCTEHCGGSLNTKRINLLFLIFQMLPWLNEIGYALSVTLWDRIKLPKTTWLSYHCPHFPYIKRGVVNLTYIIQMSSCNILSYSHEVICNILLYLVTM